MIEVEKRMVDRIGIFLVPTTEEQRITELARAAKEAMYEPGEGWRGEARKLFEALGAVAVARRVIEGDRALSASIAFEEQVVRHAGRQWGDLSPLECRQAVTELLGKKKPTARKRSDDVPRKAFAEHVDAVSQVLSEKAPATAGLWIEADLAEPEPPNDSVEDEPSNVEDEPSNVSAEESMRLLRDWQEEKNLQRLLRGPAAETDLRLRLCHIAARPAAHARGIVTGARDDDDLIGKARQSANTLLVERAIECDESSRIGHIEAIRTLQEFLAERAPDIYDSAGIYAPPRALSLLNTILRLKPELINAIDARVPGGGAQPITWLIDSLQRAVKKRRAFAIVFDDTLL